MRRDVWNAWVSARCGVSRLAAILSCRTCHLEVLDPERHASDLHEANMQDRENRIWTYLGYGPFGSLNEYRKWADEVSKGSDPLFYAIIDTEDNIYMLEA